MCLNLSPIIQIIVIIIRVADSIGDQVLEHRQQLYVGAEITNKFVEHPLSTYMYTV